MAFNMGDINFSNTKVLGRNILYELYSNHSIPDGRKYLIDKITLFREEIELFDTTCNLIKSGTKAVYDIKTHKFEAGGNLEEPCNPLKAKKDYVVFRIKNIAKDLCVYSGKGDVTKIDSLELYLMGKLMRDMTASDLENYLESSNEENLNKGLTSLNILFGKILNSQFTSEKKKKQESTTKNPVSETGILVSLKNTQKPNIIYSEILSHPVQPASVKGDTDTVNHPSLFDSVIKVPSSVDNTDLKNDNVSSPKKASNKPKSWISRMFLKIKNFFEMIGEWFCRMWLKLFFKGRH